MSNNVSMTGDKALMDHLRGMEKTLDPTVNKVATKGLSRFIKASYADTGHLRRSWRKLKKGDAFYEIINAVAVKSGRSLADILDEGEGATTSKGKRWIAFVEKVIAASNKDMLEAINKELDRRIKK